MTSLHVSWAHPVLPNGVIIAYIVLYRVHEQRSKRQAEENGQLMLCISIYFAINDFTIKYFFP